MDAVPVIPLPHHPRIAALVHLDLFLRTAVNRDSLMANITPDLLNLYYHKIPVVQDLEELVHAKRHLIFRTPFSSLHVFAQIVRSGEGKRSVREGSARSVI